MIPNPRRALAASASAEGLLINKGPDESKRQWQAVRPVKLSRLFLSCGDLSNWILPGWPVGKSRAMMGCAMAF